MQLIHVLAKNFVIRQLEEVAGWARRFRFYLPIQASFAPEAGLFTDAACPILAMPQVSKNSTTTS